jgi:hypothetical protein
MGVAVINTTKDPILPKNMNPAQWTLMSDSILGASISRGSVDLPSNFDINLSFSLLSSYGTKATEINVDFKHRGQIDELASLSQLSKWEKSQLFGGRSSHNDPSIIEEQTQLTYNLLDNRQYKKLAELVNMRDRNGGFIYRALGSLRDQLNSRLRG